MPVDTHGYQHPPTTGKQKGGRTEEEITVEAFRTLVRMACRGIGPIVAKRRAVSVQKTVVIPAHEWQQVQSSLAGLWDLVR